MNNWHSIINLIVGVGFIAFVLSCITEMTVQTGENVNHRKNIAFRTIGITIFGVVTGYCIATFL